MKGFSIKYKLLLTVAGFLVIITLCHAVLMSYVINRRGEEDAFAQLEAANKELEAFAYSVSHDLRTPLRHIDEFLELLQQSTAGSLDDCSKHYMTTIADAAKRMGILIDDLLAFSRMGCHELASMPVDLSALAREVIRELE